MRKLQVKQLEFKGAITAFLSLIFVLLVSIVGVMVQSASIHITKSMKRADTEFAMESVFAEYHQGLLKEYEIFGKEGTDEQTISRRLWFYGAKNMEHTIRKMELLSDNQGYPFYKQAIRFMGKEVSEGNTEEAPSDGIQTDTIFSDEYTQVPEQEISEELEGILQEDGQTMPEENNPIESVKQLKQSNLLSLVVSSTESISNRNVEKDSLLSSRALSTGKGYERVSWKSSVAEKTLFTTYLVKHFPDYKNSIENHALLYEAEYLISGEVSDRENLEAVAKKLLTIRLAINYGYLLTDQTRQAEAEALALGLSALLTVPGATEIVKQAVLAAWAYGESILDLRSLFAGNRVPLVKTDETWQMQLANLTKLGTADEAAEQREFSEGITYSDYVRLFLMAVDAETLSMRALDLVELNLGVRADECITKLEVKSTCELQRNITDVFTTKFEYQ